MRILVIEDEPRILEFLARGLEAEGFSVLGARDGQEGLRLAEKAACDLVERSAAGNWQQFADLLESDLLVCDRQ